MNHHLKVNVISAKNLSLATHLGMDTLYIFLIYHYQPFMSLLIGYAEPHCILFLGCTKSTISVPPRKELKEKNRNPSIKKTIVFEQFDPKSDCLKIEFWDRHDERQEDMLIGKAEMPLHNLLLNKEDIKILKLSETSEITLSVKLFTTQPPESKLSAEEIKNPGFIYDKKLPPQPSQSSQSSQSSQPSQPSSVSSSGQFNVSGSPSSQVSSPQGQNFKAPLPPKEKKYSLMYVKPEDIKRDFPHLSRGSFGTVYTGFVRGIEEKVVIKDLEIKDQSTIDEWKKEIDMMSKTRCNYVVNVIGYSSHQRILTIIMEYMRKGSLYDVLHVKKQPLSLLQRMRMARHCALGLEFMHNLGVIHRDIKSMNILVADDLSCKLTDFGTAKNISTTYQQMNTANSGTPLWMAPEVKMGMPYDFSADIYSLGLVLFELFEMKLPHYNQMTQSVELPHSFKSSTIVLNCIARNPKLRPNASAVVGIMNKMIRNVLSKVRNLLDTDEETLIKIKAMNLKEGQDETEAELLALYMHLLQKQPEEVDKLINKAFGEAEDTSSSGSSSSGSQYVNKYSNMGHNYQQPMQHYQQQQGMPPQNMQPMHHYQQQPMMQPVNNYPQGQPMVNYQQQQQPGYYAQQYQYYPPM